MSATSGPSQILILGAGVFGLSTALALLRRPAYYNSNITILDASPTLPNPSGSSVDSSRIVRADYAHAPYARLALEAQLLWRDTSDDGWGGQGRYHEPGFVLTADAQDVDSYVMKSLRNVRSLAQAGLGGLDLSKLEVLPNKETLRKASGHSGVSGDSGYVNWASGWADAEACIAYTLALVKTEGGERVVIRSGCKVGSLLFESSEAGRKGLSRCTGVQLEDHSTLDAGLVILAAGSWSPTLVDLRGRAIATGQCLAYLDISEGEQLAMGDRPTVMNMSNGMFLIPPRGRELKVARHGWGYRNLMKISTPGVQHNEHLSDEDSMEISVPVTGIAVPPEGQKACRDALNEFLPDFEKRPFARTRVCWYCDTYVCSIHFATSG